jgi:hypothetical protein
MQWLIKLKRNLDLGDLYFRKERASELYIIRASSMGLDIEVKP